MKKRLSSKDIDPRASRRVRVQRYGTSQVIADVQVVELPYFVDDSGYFLELVRWTDAVLDKFPQFQVQQMNYSLMDPGAIKAWHIHYQQEDIWFVPPSDKLVVVLRDCRKRSSTPGVTMRFVLGGGKAKLLYIPRGVAHGLANFSTTPVTVLYLVNNQFTPDPKCTDEKRLPWDWFGKDIWERSKE